MGAYGIRTTFTPELELAITTPHQHEDDSVHAPLWIIWKLAVSEHGNHHPAPAIDVICNSEENCRYNLGALLEGWPPNLVHLIFVERVPANHRFGSSMEDYFLDKGLMKVKDLVWKYKREGD